MNKCNATCPNISNEQILKASQTFRDLYRIDIDDIIQELSNCAMPGGGNAITVGQGGISTSRQMMRYATFAFMFFIIVLNIVHQFETFNEGFDLWMSGKCAPSINNMLAIKMGMQNPICKASNETLAVVGSFFSANPEAVAKIAGVGAVITGARSAVNKMADTISESIGLPREDDSCDEEFQTGFEDLLQWKKTQKEGQRGRERQELGDAASSLLSLADFSVDGGSRRSNSKRSNRKRSNSKRSNRNKRSNRKRSNRKRSNSKRSNRKRSNRKRSNRNKRSNSKRSKRSNRNKRSNRKRRS